MTLIWNHLERQIVKNKYVFWKNFIIHRFFCVPSKKALSKPFKFKFSILESAKAGRLNDRKWVHVINNDPFRMVEASYFLK